MANSRTKNFLTCLQNLNEYTNDCVKLLRTAKTLSFGDKFAIIIIPKAANNAIVKW